MWVFVSVQQWNISTYTGRTFRFVQILMIPRWWIVPVVPPAASHFCICFILLQISHCFFISCFVVFLNWWISFVFVLSMCLCFLLWATVWNWIKSQHPIIGIQSKNPDGNNSCSLKRGNDFHDGCLRRCLITWESSVSSVSHFIRADIFYIFTLHNKGI